MGRSSSPGTGGPQVSKFLKAVIIVDQCARQLYTKAGS